MSLERRSGGASHYAEERLNKGGRDSTGIPGTGETQIISDFENFVHDAGCDEHLASLLRHGFRQPQELTDANARDLYELCQMPYAVGLRLIGITYPAGERSGRGPIPVWARPFLR